MIRQRLLIMAIILIAAMVLNVLFNRYMLATDGSIPSIVLGVVGGVALMGFVAINIETIKDMNKVSKTFDESVMPILASPPIKPKAKEESPIVCKVHDANIRAMRLVEVKEYTKDELDKYLSSADLDKLLASLDDYSANIQSHIEITTQLSSCNGLTRTDVFHYVWNVWHHMNIANRHFSCHFFIKVMPGLLEGISEKTMYAKMTKDYGSYSIPLYEDIVKRRLKN